MIIATVVPNNYFAPWEFVNSLLRAERSFVSFQGPLVHVNRNDAVTVAKEHKQHLLFIDSDIVFTREQVDTMERHLQTKDIVTGVYVMGFPPHEPALWELQGDKYELVKPQKELHTVGACGAGFLAISYQALEKLPDDPFNLMALGNNNLGEDIAFCHRATEAGIDIWCDPTVRIGHIRQKTLYWHN